MKEISKAINAVMSEINGVAKNMTVGSGSNSYQGVSDKDVKQLIRDSMIKNGLSILPIGISTKMKMDRWEEADMYAKIQPGEERPLKTKQSVFTEVETKYLLLHESGESIELSGYGQGVDTQDKGAGKATTYALKNTLLNMFLIPTGIDTDNTHSDEYDVPKAKPIQSYSNNNDVKWYNDTSKNLETWRVMVAEGKTTPQEIIEKIESQGFKLSKANKDSISNIF